MASFSLSNKSNKSNGLQSAVVPSMTEVVLFQAEDYPRVLLAIFVEHMTPFLEDFFQKLANLDYPKDKINLFIHYNVSFSMGISKHTIRFAKV